MDIKLRHKIEAAIVRQKGVRLSFEEAADLVSADQPDLSVSCCGSDLATAAIVLRAREMGFEDRQIISLISLILTRAYEVLANPSDLSLIQQITNEWRRRGEIPAKCNSFDVMSWLSMLTQEQVASLSLPVIPNDLIHALNRVRLGIEKRRESTP